MNDFYKQKLVEDCIQLIHSLKLVHGDDAGSSIWKEMAKHLDPAINGEVTFNIIKGISATHVTVIPKLNGPMRTTDESIQCIKLIRSLTGQGLKEAKDLGIALMSERKPIKVVIQPDRRLYAIREFKKLGFESV